MDILIYNNKIESGIIMKKLSKREYEIMKYFWKSERPLCVSDIEECLKTENLAYVTIASFIKKLTKKGALKISHKEGAFIYYLPNIERNEYERFIIDGFLQKNYGTSFIGVVARFCGKEKFSEKEERELLDLLEKFEEK